MKKWLIITLSGIALVLIITLLGIFIFSQKQVRIHTENKNVMLFFESLATPGDTGGKDEAIKLREREKDADISILSPAPGVYKSMTQNNDIIAVDPLVWILDEDLLPLKSHDIRLQGFDTVILSLWEGEGYPILIPGDIPGLILPILIKLQEDITGEPPLNVLKNFNDYLLTIHELRTYDFFDEAFALLDKWVSTGALSPQWEDYDETAFRKAVKERDSAVFLQNLSWKRMQPKDLSFFWTALLVIPGEGRNRFSITGKALELTISPRKAVNEELQVIRERMRGAEVPAALIKYTGYVPTIRTGPFTNKEDRDSRSVLRGAADWIVYP